jgi:hypothetical protein
VTNYPDLLPINIDQGTEEDFEALGFRFGKAVDKLFRRAKLPKGWTRQQPGGYIVDPDGYQRAWVIDRADYFGHSAWMGIIPLPRTAEQEDAWTECAKTVGLIGDEHVPWSASPDVASDRREGPNYVFVFWKMEAVEDRTDTGLRWEFEVAPDGSIVRDEQVQVEPVGQA